MVPPRGEGSAADRRVARGEERIGGKDEGEERGREMRGYGDFVIMYSYIKKIFPLKLLYKRLYSCVILVLFGFFRCFLGHNLPDLFLRLALFLWATSVQCCFWHLVRKGPHTRTQTQTQTQSHTQT